MPTAFALQLHGPPQLLRGGVPLHLGSRKALALLVLLALGAAGRREALATLLWPQQDAAGARRNLRREVFRLRGFGLELDTGDAALIALPAGLGLVPLGQGQPLEGLDSAAGEDFALWLQARRAGLVQQQRQALLQSAALPQWLLALDDDPADEELLRLAMVALADAGQPARALGLYWRSVDVLRTRFDLAPAAATVALAESLRSPAAARPPLLAERAPFVPRADVQSRIAAAWNAGRTVWLAGVAGAGKTRLASECAATRGAWLRVACGPTDAELPYAGAVRALRLLREAAPDVALPDWVARELAQVMPELGSAPQPLATAEARARLLAAFGQALRLLLSDNFNVLVLDDWQWADAASLELWRALDEQALPLLRLVAYRSAQLPPAALQHMRAEVDAGHAVAVELGGFDADETLALVHALSRSPGGALFSRRLQQATAGNPFFLLETLRHLHGQGLLQVDADGQWSTPFDDVTADYAELPVPASVRDAVLGRVRALGPATQRMLQMASLLDAPPDTELLSAVADLPPGQVLAGLAHAQAARLLAAGAPPGFAHDLVRQCLAESLPAAQRQQAHARIAAVLATRGAPPSLVALQFERAGMPADAVPWRQQAGDAAWRVHALAEAGQHWRQALANGPPPDAAVAAWLALAALHRRQADVPASLAAARQALASAELATAATRLRARLVIAELWTQGDRVDDAAALLDTLATDLAVAPPAERARALDLQSTMAAWAGRLDEAARLRDAALALLEGQSDTLQALGAMLDSAARQALGSGQTAQAAALARRAVAALEAAGEPPGLADALVIDGVCCLYGQGDAAAAFQRFERARHLAARCGLVPAHRGAILNLVKLHTDAGRSSEALALLEEGEALAPGFEHQAAEQAFLQAHYFLHYLRGELPQAEVAADRLLAMARRVANRTILVNSLLMVADLDLHRARWDQAAARLDEAEAQTALAPLPACTALLAAKQAWLALGRGNLAAARACLPPSQRMPRDEDRWVLAWISAAVALAGNDHAAASAALQAVDLAGGAPTDMLAMVLVQHLHLARRQGADDSAARARAQALLAEGSVPALEAARLRSALNGVFNAESTPPA